MVELIEERLPQKEIFYVNELLKYLFDIRGFSRRSIYNKIESGELQAVKFSERGTAIRRETIISYFKSQTILRRES